MWAAIPALAALMAAVARWVIQGSGNVYTATTKRFYVPDPDLGWRVADGGPVWLGLEVIAVVGAVVAGLLVAGWLVRRWERKRNRRITWARAGLWVVAVLPLALPAWAFASGLGPARGVEQLPEGASAEAPTTGLEGALPLPAGRYEVVPHRGTAVTAKLAAGKESFEARFGRGIVGAWTADPGDLTKAGEAEIQLDPTVVDTGIALRSEHARDEYLRSGTYPHITLRLGRLIATRQDNPGQVAFRAQGELEFLGDKLTVEITGNLRAPDAAGRARLGFTATDAVALIDADLAVTVSGTKLKSDADSFDTDRIPIHVSLVLVRRA
jgi:polyisoprenoid-binding protein YceI